MKEELGDSLNEARAKHTDGLSSKVDVERAMHNLWEMEHKLLGEAKRQRLAIEASNLEALAAQEEEAYAIEATANGSAKHISSAVSTNGTKRNGNIKTESDVAEQAGSLDDDEVGDRGSKRPPPVNSNRLPLPWTGRLGYVSKINLSCHKERKIKRFVYTILPNYHAGMAKADETVGLPEHISSHSKSTGLLFEDVSHKLHS